MVTSLNHTASIVGKNVVSTGKVAGNVADQCCWGCFAWLLGLLGNIGMDCARVLSIVKNRQLAREMLAWTLDKRRKRGRNK